MDLSPGLPPLALIAGPTASGKSELAVRLAQRMAKHGRRAIVVNADSAQVYADLKVLSARPTIAEMEGVEHRLYGAWDGGTPCSAADWASKARAEIEAIHAADALPILCGGTGLYLRVLLDGIAPVPQVDPIVRVNVRAFNTLDLRSHLEREDPQAAMLIGPRDMVRMQRALEVVRSTGKSLSAWQREKRGGIGHTVQLYPCLLLPDRQWLYDRCNRRFAWMLDNGAIEEVRALQSRGLANDLPVMRAIGVPEITSYLASAKPDMATLLQSGQQATRNYAKRQYTWFRNQPPANWPRVATQDEALAEFEQLGLLSTLMPLAGENAKTTTARQKGPAA